MDLNENHCHIYWKQMADAVNDGMMVVSLDGRIIMTNHAMTELTEYAREDLIGSLCTIIKCDACDRVRANKDGGWCKLFEMDRVIRKRCHFMRKSGSYISALKTARTLKDDQGQVVGAVEIFTDLTPINQRDQKIEALSFQLAPEIGYCGLVGQSPAMIKLFNIIEKAAQNPAPVIIYGESGTGKELVAHAIHDMGERKDGPFIQFNCAALNDALLESELFGHVKGAFSGAYRHRVGRFEAADGGDIFLDEIGDIPPATQAKLLRVLETKTFERVGDHQPVSVDVRIISATNRKLEQLVQAGKFREDLFFRINVIPIHIPPLRERADDIPLLVNDYLKRLNAKTEKAITGVAPDVMGFFMQYAWPGNVRELKSVMQYAFVVAEGGLIGFHHLPEYMTTGHHAAAPEQRIPVPSSRVSMADPAHNEREKLIQALCQAGGNKSKAAEILGVHRMTVWNRMKKYGVNLEKTVEQGNRM